MVLVIFQVLEDSSRLSLFLMPRLARRAPALSGAWSGRSKFLQSAGDRAPVPLMTGARCMAVGSFGSQGHEEDVRCRPRQPAIAVSAK